MRSRASALPIFPAPPVTNIDWAIAIFRPFKRSIIDHVTMRQCGEQVVATSNLSALQPRAPVHDELMLYRKANEYDLESPHSPNASALF
jgi:hypothetical protein